MKPPARPALSLEPLEARCLPTTIAPSALTDSGSPRANTLRRAILAANADATADDFTISLRSGTYALTRRNTAGQENAAGTGDLDVTTTAHKVVITGRGTRGLRMTVIDATALRDRIFHLLDPGVRLELHNLVLKGGLARDDGTDQARPRDGDAQGGAVLNNGGSLTLINVLVTGNRAFSSAGNQAQGGGLFSDGGSVVLGRNATGVTALTKNLAAGNNGSAITPTTFTSGLLDAAPAQGGGLYAGGGTVTITAASFVGNIARGGSGANARNTVFTSTSGPPVAGTADGGAGASGQGGGLYASGASVTLNLATFSGNRAEGGSGGNSAPAGGAGGDGGPAAGGGVFAEGGLTVTDSTFTKNIALGGNGGRSSRGGPGGAAGDGAGGGLLTAGDVSAQRSTLSFNAAIGGAGGQGGRGTRFDANGADGGGAGSARGGGLHVSDGDANLANLTFVANAVQGGAGGGAGNGLRVAGTTSLGTPSTGIGGSGGAGGAGAGGGLFAGGGTLTLVSSTFSGNAAGKGRGGAAGGGPMPGVRGAAGASQGGGVAGGGSVRNTLLAGNTADAGPDFFGTAAAASGNLLGVGDGAAGFAGNGNQAGTAAAPINPRLGRLGRNGGPTATLVPLAGSPAINAGDDAASPGATDQRGATRVVNGIDVGAVEVQADLRLTAAASVTSVRPGGTITYTLTVSNLGPDPASLLVLRSAVPTGATFVALTVPRGWGKMTPAAGGTGAITATLPAMPSGGRTVVELVVRIGLATTGGLELTAILDSALDPVAGNNSDDRSVPVVP